MCAPYFIKVNKNSFQLKTLLFFVHLRAQQKRTEKVISNYHIDQPINIYSCHFDIVILRVAIISNAQNVCLQGRHRLTDDASTRRWRGSQRPLPGARSMDLVDGNRFRKSSTPRLLHFLFETSLINRVTPYFFDSQTFFINILPVSYTHLTLPTILRV